MALDIRILGPLEVRSHGQARALGGHKQRALLAALIIRRGQVVATERLIEDVWGGARGPAAARSIQVYVSALRKALGDAHRIRHDGGGYLLDVASEELDAQRFEGLVEEGRALRGSGDAARARRVLEQALGLWRGPALADVQYEAFARAEAERLEELRLVASEERIESDLALGRHREVLPDIEALVADHPLRERLHEQHMLALYRCGRQADAIAAYRTARLTLVDELGIEPGRALRELEGAILRQDAELDVEPADLRARRRLPAPATPLIGRRREVDDVVALARGDARLVTLTGSGGTGKTRVALQAAHELADRFPDGVVWIGLAAVRDHALVPVEIARGVGVDDVEALAERLADRRLLLLLDNFEHVEEAAPVLSTLLRTGPDLRLLVTSRQPLRIYGEYEYRVPPLRLLDEAVPLFIARARAGGTRLGASEPLTEICRVLDCLPLAIELAAGRADELAPRDMLARLPARLALAAEGPRDLDARQRTLTATIRWSFELLSERERELAEALAVFAGGWAPDAAEAVCGATLEELSALAARSVIGRGDGRFAMLATTREFALDGLLASEQADRVRTRHAEHYLVLAVDVDRGLRGGGDQVALLRSLEVENDNLRAALDWLAGRDHERELRLAGALASYWALRGHGDEGLGRLERALSRDAGATLERAKALVGGSTLAWDRGDYTRSRAWALESLAIYRAAGDGSGMVRALMNIGFVGSQVGGVDEARVAYEECLAIARDSGAPRDVVLALGGLTDLALASGDLAEARRRGEESLAIAREIGDHEGGAVALLSLGYVALHDARQAEAVRLLTEATDAYHALGDLGPASYGLDGLAALAAGAGRAREAAALLGAAETLRATTGTPAAFEPSVREQAIVAARGTLGEPEFIRARAEGLALGVEAALALAGTVCVA
jgi:predicted ATPase/DNA-binding SARP family transcriptional activator